MTRPLLFLGIILMMAGCSSRDSRKVLAQNTIQYQVSKNRYAVVVVEDGISPEEAKKEAVRQAAEVVVGQGDRYFVIEEAKEVVAMRAGDNRLEGNDRPRNLYYELIQSDNFGRERLNSSDPYAERAYLAWRIVFSTHKEPVKGAIDAYKYTFGNT